MKGKVLSLFLKQGVAMRFFSQPGGFLNTKPPWTRPFRLLKWYWNRSRCPPPVWASYLSWLVSFDECDLGNDLSLASFPNSAHGIGYLHRSP